MEQAAIALGGDAGVPPRLKSLPAEP